MAFFGKTDTIILDSIILLGDFNAELGKLIIPGDIHDMSPSGKFLDDIIENSSLEVLNTHKNGQGIFTRVQKNLGRVEGLSLIMSL